MRLFSRRFLPLSSGEPDPSSFGYRKGHKTADALAKIWREVEAGNEWIVDADLKDSHIALLMGG